jgi:hypothetical protein
VHIDATPPVHKIMGDKIKSGKQEKLLIVQGQDWKKEVKVWAAFLINNRREMRLLKLLKMTILQLLQ